MLGARGGGGGEGGKRLCACMTILFFAYPRKSVAVNQRLYGGEMYEL
jgi:hypothetical protein